MSSGLCFERLQNGEIIAIHVAPTDEYGQLESGHTVTAVCVCDPIRGISQFGDLVWTHRRYATR